MFLFMFLFCKKRKLIRRTYANKYQHFCITNSIFSLGYSNHWELRWTRTLLHQITNLKRKLETLVQIEILPIKNLIKIGHRNRHHIEQQQMVLVINRFITRSKPDHNILNFQLRRILVRVIRNFLKYFCGQRDTIFMSNDKIKREN